MNSSFLLFLSCLFYCFCFSFGGLRVRSATSLGPKPSLFVFVCFLFYCGLFFCIFVVCLLFCFFVEEKSCFPKRAILLIFRCLPFFLPSFPPFSLLPFFFSFFLPSSFSFLVFPSLFCCSSCLVSLLCFLEKYRFKLLHLTGFLHQSLLFFGFLSCLSFKSLLFFFVFSYLKLCFASITQLFVFKNDNLKNTNFW